MRLAERRVPVELSWRGFGPETGVGLALFGLPSIILASFGVFLQVGKGGLSGAVVALVLASVTAVTEEIVFRGFLFRTVRTISGTWTAVTVSAILFGALHAFNPGATLLSTVATALEAGILLALAYAATDRLSLPIGLHAGWSYAEGFIFGTPVSGHIAVPSLLHGQLHGITLLTGGAFGPEASAVAIGVCLMASGAFGIQTVRREKRASEMERQNVIVSGPSIVSYTDASGRRQERVEL